MTDEVELMRLMDDGCPNTEPLDRAPRTCSRCPAFIWTPQSVATGLCFGCRAPGPTQRIELPSVAITEDDGEAD